jgi:hypothetical protein
VFSFAAESWSLRPPEQFRCIACWHGLAQRVLKLAPDMTDREAKSRAVKILAKSLYRDLEAQGFDEKQIVAFATELISEVTSKIARTEKAQRLA